MILRSPTGSGKVSLIVYASHTLNIRLCVYGISLCIWQLYNYVLYKIIGLQCFRLIVDYRYSLVFYFKIVECGLDCEL